MADGGKRRCDVPWACARAARHVRQALGSASDTWLVDPASGVVAVFVCGSNTFRHTTPKGLRALLGTALMYPRAAHDGDAMPDWVVALMGQPETRKEREPTSGLDGWLSATAPGGWLVRPEAADVLRGVLRAHRAGILRSLRGTPDELVVWALGPDDALAAADEAGLPAPDMPEATRAARSVAAFMRPQFEAGTSSLVQVASDELVAELGGAPRRDVPAPSPAAPADVARAMREDAGAEARKARGSAAARQRR